MTTRRREIYKRFLQLQKDVTEFLEQCNQLKQDKASELFHEKAPKFLKEMKSLLKLLRRKSKPKKTQKNKNRFKIIAVPNPNPQNKIK